MTDTAVYRQQNFGIRTGFGESPALLVVDFQYAFTNPGQLGGQAVTDAIENTIPLLQAMRARNYPIAFGRYVTAGDPADLGPFGAKCANLHMLTEEAHESQIVAALEPREGEYIIRKKHSSCFFGTNLSTWLVWRRVDTLVVVGVSTSGCVRASVIDSSAHGFRTIVVADCCGDRAVEPHRANLFDMDQKYADVMSLKEVLAHETIRSR